MMLSSSILVRFVLCFIVLCGAALCDSAMFLGGMATGEPQITTATQPYFLVRYLRFCRVNTLGQRVSVDDDC